VAQSVLLPEPAASTLPRQHAARAVPSQPGLRLPLLYKVLLANASIVLLGAVAGTWATMAAMRAAGEGGGMRLGAALAVLGLLLSIATNYVVLRAAFRPLTALAKVAEAVRAGDLSARAEPLAGGDPQVAHLAEAFDRTLDQLERDRTELRSLASQVIRAQEEERKRVSRELHDDTAQILFAQLLRVTALKGSPSADVRATATALEETTVEALEGVRRLALELRPPALDDLGLTAALADLAQRFGEQLAVPVGFQARGLRGRLPADVELVLYRVAQEALTNVAKHGQATAVSVDLDRGPCDVTLSVRDNGRGFDPRAATAKADDAAGLGLFGMVERVSLVGGRATIWSSPGRGTEVFAYIPLAEPRGGGDRGAVPAETPA
jgi:two-component system sensor histidine kinase UhpB